MSKEKQTLKEFVINKLLKKVNTLQDDNANLEDKNTNLLNEKQKLNQSPKV